jgi:uncharacterized BrkB/YihY/UPF0761 family membrane protein
VYHPWWQLIVGDGIMKINASPMNTHFGLFDTHFVIPLIYALNISSILTFTCSGTIMLIYSFIPTKQHAKELLKFAWKKPLYSVITNIACLTMIITLANIVFGLKLPIIGTAITTLPPQYTGNAHIAVNVTAAFQWPLYLAITAATLCIIAKIYHNKKFVTLNKTTNINTPQKPTSTIQSNFKDPQTIH